MVYTHTVIWLSKHFAFFSSAANSDAEWYAHFFKGSHETAVIVQATI